MLVSGDAPVPPSWPEISTTSAVRLGHAGRDGADADFGDQLHVNARAADWRSSDRKISCARSSIE